MIDPNTPQAPANQEAANEQATNEQESASQDAATGADGAEEVTEG